MEASEWSVGRVGVPSVLQGGGGREALVCVCVCVTCIGTGVGCGEDFQERVFQGRPASAISASARKVAPRRDWASLVLLAARGQHVLENAETVVVVREGKRGKRCHEVGILVVNRAIDVSSVVGDVLLRDAIVQARGKDHERGPIGGPLDGCQGGVSGSAKGSKEGARRPREALVPAGRSIGSGVCCAGKGWLSGLNHF